MVYNISTESKRKGYYMQKIKYGSNNMRFQIEGTPIITMVNRIKTFENTNKIRGLNLQPDYQRGYIWSTEFKDALLFSIFRINPIGTITLHDKADVYDLVDGQQRLRTIYDFYNDGYTIKSEFSRKIIEHLLILYPHSNDSKMSKLRNRLKNKGHISLGFKHLPEYVQEDFMSYNLNTTIISYAEDEDIREYFRFLQNQERLLAGEIINTIPASNLDMYLNKIKHKKLFLKKMSYENKRHQFDKIFYGHIGVLDNQLTFGMTDKSIINFAIDNDVLSDQTIEQINKTIEDINYITSDDTIKNNFIDTTADTRFMKYFLLLSSLNFVDFKKDTAIKLKNLEKINNKLSAFNSSKPKIIEKTFIGYDPKVINEYQSLANIARGSHPLKRLKKVIEVLAYYVNDFENKSIPLNKYEI